MPLRIANGAGFLGDNLDAPRLLVQSAEVDYLTLEYLAELTLSILARQRQKDPEAGYARDFLEVLKSLLPALRQQNRLRIVTNGGGVNPLACARQSARQLVAAGLPELSVAAVTGDALLEAIPKLQQAGVALRNLDTGQPLAELQEPVVSANAYLGAAPIVQALEQGARVVITGRVADASLTVAPAVHEFGWKWDDWNRLAAASVAGHLIECGAQVTGGYSTRWENVELASIGYPIAELSKDGDTVITKPAGSGGVMNRHTVVEQLVYEIGDPKHYLTPDVDVDFTAVEVEERSPDRIAVSGARGQQPPDTYKVSLAYHAGYQASGQLLVYGHDWHAKALACAEIVKRRLERAGLAPKRLHVELLGTGASAGQSAPLRSGPSQRSPDGGAAREIILRLTAQDARRDAVERFTRELAPLITSGPAGLAGYTSARGSVQPIFAYWPTLVPKSAVTPRVTVRSAKQWAA